MQNTNFGELFSEAKSISRSLEQGEFLFHKGDTASHIYTVESGCIRLLRYSLEGTAVSMHLAKPGKSFAETSLFSDMYHCSAEALIPSVVNYYEKQKIIEILHVSPENSAAFIEQLSSLVKDLRSLLEIRSIHSAEERVFHYLLLQSTPDTFEVKVIGTLKNIAEELAIAHETLYRSLATLESKGKILRTSESIRILI